MRGPSFPDQIEDTLPRKELVEEVWKIIKPHKHAQGYSLIVGEHGTGKSSLILTLNELGPPKGVVYLSILNTDDVDSNPLVIADTLRDALDWRKDETDSLGTTAPLQLLVIFRVFSTVSLKYRTTFHEIPVLIIDNANRLPSPILAQFQDFAKEAADRGSVPRTMRGTSILPIAY